MEELLNKLIKRGWKPFGWDDKLSSLHKEFGVGKWYIRFHNGMDSELFDLRQLTSKESGLWQFVCEMSVHNNYNKEKGKIFTWKKFEDDKYQINGYSNGGGYIQDYEYWLIESSLKDEDELDKFLLENIKIS